MGDHGPKRSRGGQEYGRLKCLDDRELVIEAEKEEGRGEPRTGILPSLRRRVDVKMVKRSR
jgi:hypothetical protein